MKVSEWHWSILGMCGALFGCSTKDRAPLPTSDDGGLSTAAASSEAGTTASDSTRPSETDAGAGCVPQSKRCNGRVPERCDEQGRWQSASPCDGDTPACIEQTGECGRCTEGSHQCDGDVLLACDEAGAWTVAETCDGAQICHAKLGRCADCSPSTSPACVDDAHSALCSEEGTWDSVTRCAEDAPHCNAATGRCECADGARRCDGEMPFECLDGEWVDGEPCDGDTPACDAERGVCVCPDSDVGCTPEGAPRRCSDGQWVEQDVCSGATPVCDPESGACQCAEDSVTCDGDVPQRCSDGAWQAQRACSGETPRCDATTGTCVCEEDARDCGAGGVPRQCVAGAWQEAAACRSGSQVCAEGQCICLDDEVAQTTLVEHATFGCGQSWKFTSDTTSAWVVYDSGLHVDAETNVAWYYDSGFRTRTLAATFCTDLSVAGLTEWRLPTVDDVRQLAAGCAPSAPGGTCAVSATCAALSCGDACDACSGGQGPHEGGTYLRPNVQISSYFHTSTACSDCTPAATWVYLQDNGYFTTVPANGGIPTACVHALP